VSEGGRRALFLIAAVPLGLLYLWGAAGLPPSGHYPGPYGHILNAVTVPERHATDVVSAVNFDYRGLDTLGEEFILFASILGVTMLLRQSEEEGTHDDLDDDRSTQREPPGISDAVRLATLALVGFGVVYGLYVLVHGADSPGGGFQAGVVLATVPLLVYLAGDTRAFHRIAPHGMVEAAEAVGVLGYLAIGLFGLALGAEFLRNVLPLGPIGKLNSGGTISAINLSTGLEVSAGFVVLMQAFLAELLSRRRQEKS
jgi:multicomponent Na+:H+ antiporter subunit B